MESKRNRSSVSETTSGGTPKSPSPDSHLRRQYQHLNYASSFQSHESLESAFARLNFNNQYSYSVNNGEFSHGLNEQMYLPLGWQEQKTEEDLLRVNLQNSDIPLDYTAFQDFISDGPFCGLYHAANNFTRNGGLATNPNGFSNGVVFNNPTHLTPDYPYVQKPQWLQQPLGFMRVGNLRGRIVALAKDQNGCRFLQNTMSLFAKEEVEMVFLEILDHIFELMIDPFGNYVVQKLIEVCSEEQRTQIIFRLVSFDFQLVRICLNMHGTRAVQKLLENLTTLEQVSLASAAIAAGAVALTKDMNGHHVILHCLKHFSAEDNKYLLNQVAYNCYGIATDRCGCCVLQQCVDFSKGEQRNRLLSHIIENVLPMSEDPFGNYVVQHIIDLRIPRVTESLVSQLHGSFIFLSFNKYGSNVVERCLRVSGENHSMRIIIELLNSPDAPRLLGDPYGNYVIQSALIVSKGFAHKALVDLIEKHYPMMRSNMYGRKVLACFDKRKTLYRY